MLLNSVEGIKKLIKENKKELLRLGVNYIAAAYAGSGDEGFVEIIEGYKENPKNEMFFVNDGIKLSNIMDDDFVTKLDDEVNEATSYGYENGVGGGGRIVINVKSGKITHYSYNIVEEQDDNPKEVY